MAKKLYIVVSDGGDGSYYPKFTMNEGLIAKMQKAYDNGKMDYENGYGCDGDGFHYTTLNVPDDTTYESLGLVINGHMYGVISDDFADRFFSDEDDDE